MRGREATATLGNKSGRVAAADGAQHDQAIGKNNSRRSNEEAAQASLAKEIIKEWIPDDEPDLDWFNRPPNLTNPDPEEFDQSPTRQATEIQLDDARTLDLEST